MNEIKDDNAQFGLPQVGDFAAMVETAEQREARLRAKAAEIVAAESEEHMLKRLIAEQRAMVASGGIPTDTQGFPAVYDKVHIYKGRDKHDQPYVPLGINGFVLKAPRGVDIIIPACFTELLEHAVEEVTVKSMGGLVTRPAHSFPYTLKGKATAAEYKVYQAEQKARAEQQTVQVAA
jgi:hypothetical protein